jgi:hypothetical protein
LEPIYQPMIKKALPFLSVLQQIRDMTGAVIAARQGLSSHKIQHTPKDAHGSVLNPMRQRGGRPGEATAEDKDEGPWLPLTAKARKWAGQIFCVSGNVSPEWNPFFPCLNGSPG